VATLADAVDQLIGANLKRLPVTDDAGHLMGMLTRSDILREIVFAAADTTPQADSLLDWQAQVSDVELEPALTAGADTLVTAVIDVLRAHGQRRLVIVDADQRVIGLLTETDLLSRSANGQRAHVLARLEGRGESGPLDTLTGTARQYMTTPVITVRADSAASDALRLMIENQIKRLPVVDASGRVQGMVSRAGLMRALFETHGGDSGANGRA